jgi:DNA repair ATPase RecN
MDKFFDSLDDSFQAMMEAVRTGNERGLRFSRKLMNEIEEGQKELSSLGRKFSRNPRDSQGLYQASAELARRSMTNSSNLAKEWLMGAQEAGRDAQSTATKVIKANQSAARALGAAIQANAAELASRVPVRGRKTSGASATSSASSAATKARNN